MSTHLTNLIIGVPDHWWIAQKADYQMLEDVDALEEPRDHRADRGQRDWSAMANIIEEVGQALVTGGTTQNPDQPAGHHSVTTDLSALHPEDAKIVRSWFTVNNEEARGDGWWPDLVSGRHRAWSLWLHEHDALLPIYSEQLRHTEDPNWTTGEGAAGILQVATDGLATMLPGVANPRPYPYIERQGVAERNPHYITRLREVIRVAGTQDRARS